MGSRIIGWKLFWHQCYLDLQDLRPFRFWPKNQRGHEVTKTTASMKFECQGPIGCPVISQKPFWHEVYIDLG
jgi:hypothetical protein